MRRSAAEAAVRPVSMRETLDADHLSLVATSSPVSPEASRSRRNSAASWRPRADGDFEAGNVDPSGDAWGAVSAFVSNVTTFITAVATSITQGIRPSVPIWCMHACAILCAMAI